MQPTGDTGAPAIKLPSRPVAIWPAVRARFGAALFALVVALELAAVWYDLPKASWFHAGPVPPGSWWLEFQGLRGWKTFAQGGWSWPVVASPPFRRWLPMLLVAGAVLAVVVLFERRRGWLRGWETAVALLLLVAGGYGLELAALYLKNVHPSQLLYDRIVNFGFTGYFSSALSIHDGSTLSSGYLAALQQPGRLCFHCVSHPPGPILFFWLPWRALEGLPLAAQASLARWAGEFLHVGYGGMAPAAAIVAMLSPHAMLLLAALVVLPLYGLARLLGGPEQALRGAAAGIALPGLIVMSPELDQVYATFTAGVLLLLLLGVARPRQALRWGFLAGLAWSFGLYFSLALEVVLAPLAFLVLAAILGFHATGDGERRTLRWLGLWLGALVAGVVAPWIALRLAGHFDILAVIAECKHKHMSGWTEHLPKRPWMLYDLVDFSQFLGVPLAAFSLLTLVRTSPRRGATAPGPWPVRWAGWIADRVNLYALLFWAVVAVLDLSGLTRGEVGRLWIFLGPLALLGVYHGFAQPRRDGPRFDALLVSQLAVLALIAGRWSTP